MKKLLIAIMALGIGTTAANAAAISLDQNNPSVVTIKGTIGSYDWNTFQRVVEGQDIKKVVLTSPGGSVKQGDKIAEWIYNRPNVKTEAKGKCVSECGVIWLAGHDHDINGTEVIGFHLPFIGNATALINYKEIHGIQGIEEITKTTSVDAMMHYWKYINNKLAFGDFMKNIKEKGYSRSLMWNLTQDQIYKYEGNNNVGP